MHPSRRLVLAGVATLFTSPASWAAPAPEAQQVDLDVGGRAVIVRVWRPVTPRGVILFSHGGNGNPEAYAALAGFWRDAGFLVAAPLHTDSLKNTTSTDRSLQTAFGTRIADLAATRAWAQKAAPGLPIAAAGHSYGSLIAMTMGGALDAMVHARDPAIQAVIAFSSPGNLPGLIGPQSYQPMTAPLLLLTGDADVVPGFVANWRDHLTPFETSPAGSKYAWVGKGVDHSLAGRDPARDPALGEAAALSLDFLQAHLLGASDAAQTLAKRAPTALADFRTR